MQHQGVEMRAELPQDKTDVTPKPRHGPALADMSAADREHNLHVVALIGAGVVAISLAMMGLHLVVQSRRSVWEKAVDRLGL